MKTYICLILPLFFLSCAVNRIKEKEPNNSKWDSQAINIPINISSKIDNYDIDYYKFIAQGQNTNLIDIELSTKIPNPLNLDLYFQNKLIKSSYLLKEDYEKRENKIVFKNIFIIQGVYYIRITKKKEESEEVRYSLNIKLDSDINNKEREPNDRLVEANYINITNGYIKGFFNPAWNLALKDLNFIEADWFKFTITEKSNILSVEITSIPGIDPVIELYNDLGFLMKKADSMEVDEPEILKNFGVFREGEYFVKIYNKNIGFQNDKIPYQLYLSLKKYIAQFEFEPNDSMNQANYISETMKGYINPTFDRDWYFFEINQNQVFLNISVAPLNSVDLRLVLYNHLGEKFYVIDNYPINEAEILPNLLLSRGKYFLTVSDRSNKHQNYLDDYTIALKKTKYEENREYEPNDSYIQAINIEANNSYKGYISPKGDQDYFFFNIQQDMNLKIDISPVPDLNFIIQIIDEYKNMVQEINNRRTGEGESAILSLAAGMYYIILKDAENKGNFYENYIFSIFERGEQQVEPGKESHESN